MARVHTLVSTTLVGIGLLCASPGLAQSTSQQVPQRQIESVIPPEYKPDLVIISAKATTVCTAQGTVTAKIIAVVKNQSAKGTADLSKVPMHIILKLWTWYPANGANQLEKKPPPTILPAVGGPAILKPGQSWTGKLDILGITKYKKNPGNTAPGAAPIYGFVVRADPQNAVPESNENNNSSNFFAPDPCFKP